MRRTRWDSPYARLQGPDGMRKIVLMGRSECGKTTLTQALKGEKKEEQLYLYYVNNELNCVEAVPYTSEAKTAEELLVDLVAKQTVLPNEKEGYISLLPEGITILDYKVEDEILTLNFSSSYSSMSPSREILARAGLVRTFIQVPEVNWVKFHVNGNPLLDSSGSKTDPFSSVKYSVILAL